MSSYKKIVRAALEGGYLFEDPDFPAKSSSIYYSKSNDRIIWKRPGEISSDPKFSEEGATKHDLDQGSLGNCWFLAAAATLSTQKDLFERVVPKNQSFTENYCGAFHFHFWRYGEWVEVVIDDRLPTVDGELYFCHNKETPNEFWSALLEKAYAKVHGSYEALEAGLSHDALVDFTGGLSEEIDLEEQPDILRTKLYIRLKRLSKRNSLLCAAIYNKERTGELTLKNGLVAGHAYSITEMMKVNLKDGKNCRLVRLRNPWGKQEWNGNWSDGSEKWDELSDEDKNRISRDNKDDGEFWMTFNDLVDNFHAIQICHLTDTPRKQRAGKLAWQTLSYHGEWIKGVSAGGAGNDMSAYFMNPQYYCVLTDPDEDDDEERCTVIISLLQKYARTRRTVEKRDDTEMAIGFDVYKYKGETPEELDGFTATKKALRLEKKETNYRFVREMSMRVELEPGTYCVIPNTFLVGEEGEFLLRFATEKKIRSGEVGNENLMSSRNKLQKKPKKIDMLFDKHSGDDNVVDARELRKILNEGLAQDKDEDYSKETCRELIQSITGERRGLLDKSDCKHAWKKVKNLQQVFNDFDQDSSGTLDGKELRNAFKSLGYKLGRKAQGNIVKKYCDKRNNLSLDDFVLVSTKMSNSKDVFTTMKRRKQRKGMSAEAVEEEEDADSDDKSGVELTRDEFMEMNL